MTSFVDFDQACQVLAFQNRGWGAGHNNMRRASSIFWSAVVIVAAVVELRAASEPFGLSKIVPPGDQHTEWQKVLANVEAAKREIHDMFRQLALANVYHALGRHTESNAALGELIRTYTDTAALQIAEVYAYRGDPDPAFAWLERARAQRDAGMSMVRALPSMRHLHGDPRWVPFLKRVGLAD